MRWVQTPEDLRRQPATTAAHARMRERFLALYEITQAGCATQVAKCDERNPQTLMKWVHWYNAQGSEALVHRKSGGRPPCCAGARLVLEGAPAGGGAGHRVDPAAGLQSRQRINPEPYEVADRLWVKDHLDPEEENYVSQSRRGLVA